MNKKFIAIFFSILLIIGLLHFVNTASYHEVKSVLTKATIIDKGIENDRQYIKAKLYSDPITVKIYVDNKNTWNLVLLNHTYQIDYKVFSNHENFLDYIDCDSSAL
ncbi:MAG: hypothetical protein N4A40_14175 [Tissierellales bacterium]|jgi:hypothetical protein|nr:hypothetical protein [Tissierellales bacterium]